MIRDPAGQRTWQPRLRRKDRGGDPAKQLDIAKRRAIWATAGIEIIDLQRLLVGRAVAAERMDRQRG